MRTEAIAGIIGGEHSGCSEATVNVFLESAYFDPLRTAATGRRLGINSDARYLSSAASIRLHAVGAEIATRMILDLCGGEARPSSWRRCPGYGAALRPAQDAVKSLAGADVARAAAEADSGSAGLRVTETADTLDCAVLLAPGRSWRGRPVEEWPASTGSTTFRPPHGTDQRGRQAVLTVLQKRMLRRAACWHRAASTRR